MLSWTLGRGSVIWRIWPAVALHTVFAAAVVTISLETSVHLDIPGVMLTGVVIGFVISYRASSGYERYWMGRGCWSDLIKQTRTTGRLIWHHVPPHLNARTPAELAAGTYDRSHEEKTKVMDEKRMALDLLQAYVIGIKHHLRGERGIYYEDLYHLVKPLHDHSHVNPTSPVHPTVIQTTTSPPPIHRSPGPASPEVQTLVPVEPFVETFSISSDQHLDPIIPSINDYGTLSKQRSRPRLRGSDSRASMRSEASSMNQPLLPSALPTKQTLLSGISGDLVPFAGVFSEIGHLVKNMFGRGTERILLIPDDQQQLNSERNTGGAGPDLLVDKMTHVKHRPRVAGGGQNVPLEVMHCLSDWISVLEDRGSVPGSTLGNLIVGLANFEESLSTLEKILTTPLPFVYSVHIRHTVWLYLFFLPFQMVLNFGWYTVPGVCMASFIYLGFLAAGEEIEQPFGYDENDLDLDLFCREILHTDVESLKKTPGSNVYFGPAQIGHSRPRGFGSIVDTSSYEARKGKAGTI